MNLQKTEEKMLKRVLFVVATMVALVALGLSSLWLWGHFVAPAEAQAEEHAAEYSPVQTVTVVGQGSVRIEPDVARVSIGLETSGETIAEAVAENGALMESILDALTAAGVEEKDIQTMNFSIQLDRYPEALPRSADSESGETSLQYRVSNTVNVTIRDLDRVGEVLDAVVEAGANNVWGVSFSLDDPDVAQAEARADAIANAQARAEDLSTLSGLKLGPVMSISEVVSGGPNPMPTIAVERAMAGGVGPISPGELEIGYQIQVIYFVEP
jgi:uncharacterized protein YggE